MVRPTSLGIALVAITLAMSTGCSNKSAAPSTPSTPSATPSPLPPQALSQMPPQAVAAMQQAQQAAMSAGKGPATAKPAQ